MNVQMGSAGTDDNVAIEICSDVDLTSCCRCEHFLYLILICTKTPESDEKQLITIIIYYILSVVNLQREISNNK